MKPKVWKTRYGTLTVTQQHVIDSNGGETMWTHKEFLAKAGGTLHKILRKAYGEVVYQEAVQFVHAFKRPGGVRDNAADS